MVLEFIRQQKKSIPRKSLSNGPQVIIRKNIAFPSVQKNHHSKQVPTPNCSKDSEFESPLASTFSTPKQTIRHPTHATNHEDQTHARDKTISTYNVEPQTLGTQRVSARTKKEEINFFKNS